MSRMVEMDLEQAARCWAFIRRVSIHAATCTCSDVGINDCSHDDADSREAAALAAVLFIGAMAVAS